MSTTNRAFIKAYRQDTAQSAPIAGNSRPNAREAAVRTGTAVGAAAGSGRDPQPAASKRPLSSFIGRPQVTEVAAPNDNANLLRPGTTVASFEWPKICRSLSVQSGLQLDRVVDLFRAQAGAGHSLIGIVGLFPRVGTTTTALCLAARAARRVRRVILVDGNLRHPRIASCLEAAPTVGWQEVLKHAAPLADAVIRATGDNLDLLALSAKAPKDPQPLAAGLQAAVTAGVLRHAYDIVLIDLGTFFEPASQPIVLELVRNMGIDSVVAVTGSGPADPRDLATVAEYLEPSGCAILGTIENRIATPQAT